VAILELVRDEETYGSEIHRNLKEKFNLEEQKPVIYGLLRRMEDMDLLSSKWDTKGGGPARRVYFITEDGVEYLEEALTGLRKVREVIEVLLAGSEK
jgi:PadR family transcriptional regulator PadR